jgi:hypothetical protein
MLTPWDLSKTPTTNDRVAKLGFGVGGRAVAISTFDTEAPKAINADGVGHPVSSRARFEPDNWVFLDHGGVDRVWSIRHIVDHENPSSSAAHRSTIGVNQKKRMCWFLDQDLEWGVEIKEVGPPIPKGRGFNGAGFLSSLYGRISKGGNFKKQGQSGATFIFPATQTASNQATAPKRATRCLNTNMRGGFFTDGKYVAQLRQLFYMMPLSVPPAPGPRHVPVETESNFSNKGLGGGFNSQRGVQGEGRGGYSQSQSIQGPVHQTEGQRQNELIARDRAATQETSVMEKSGGSDSDCMVDRRMAALRGDILFDVRGKGSALAYEDVMPARGEDAYYGAHFLGIPSSWGPKYVPAEDVSSDQPILETPDAERGIRPFIYLPKDYKTPPPCQVGPHFDPTSPSYSVAGVLPPAPSGDTGEWIPALPLVDKAWAAADFPPGEVYYDFGDTPIPSMEGDVRFEILVPYVLPTNLASDEQMDFQLSYKVVQGPAETAGETWTVIKKSITAGDNPTSAHQVLMLRFELTPLHLGGPGRMGGGRIHWYLFRRSDDTADDKTFRMVGAVQGAYSPASSRRRMALAGVK